MEGYSQENPLGLPRDDQGGVHQLRVEVLAGTDHEPRANACTCLCGFLPTLPNGVTIFNNLTLPQQMAAVLITEEDQQTHQRLEHFLWAPAAFREMALVNSAHHADNSHILFNELKLGHIVNFLKM